jgi:hypothetical protein
LLPILTCAVRFAILDKRAINYFESYSNILHKILTIDTTTQAELPNPCFDALTYDLKYVLLS